jgi:tetratricopeptide (TPR) repeat protein
MPHLFFAYANSPLDPLETLQEEDDRVHSLLAPRERARHFRLLRDSNASIPKLAESLQRYQGELTLFHYGGHAGRDRLLLREGAANAAGIAQLLGRCSQLRLVMLNGCSTQEQVQALLQAAVPVVIATSAPVGDRAAAQFAIAFYQAMAEGRKTIGEAFEDGIAAAQTQHGATLRVERTRGIALGLDEAEADAPRWGLYWREAGDLGWRLPLVGEHLLSIPQHLTYVPPVNLKKVFGLAPRVESLEKATQTQAEQLIVLNGMGGIGKSTLLRAWYKQHGKRFDYRAWIDIRSAIDLGFIESAELLSSLGLRAELKDLSGQDKPLTGFSLILNRLRELNGHNLLMIDNADSDLASPAILNRLADLLPDWTIIATSRQHFKHPLIYPCEVLLLGEQDASDLFQEYYPRASALELQGLFEVLGTHPLAVELAAKALAHGTTVKTVRELTERLRRNRMDEALKEAIFRIADSEEEADIYQHLANLFQLADLDADHRWLLIQLAALPAMPLKERHLQLLLQVPAGAGHKKLNHSLQALYNQGWLGGSLEGREFFLHQMLQWVVGFQTDFALDDCRSLIDSLYRLYWDNDLDHFIPFFPAKHQEKLREDYWLLKRYFDRLKPLDAILEEALNRVPAIDDDARYYRLYRSLAWYQKETGLFSEALDSYKYYLDAALGFGDDTVEFAMEAFKFVIETLLDQSSSASLSQAEGYLEDMEAYVERHPGEQSSRRALFLTLRGRHQMILGRFKAAKASLSEALRIYEGQIPADEAAIAAAQNNLATVLQDLGDYAGTKTLLEKVLVAVERHFEPEHPTTAVYYSNLATVLQDLGDYAGAKALLEKALTSDERNFGPDHPTTAVRYSNLALVLKALGDYAGAKALLEKAMASDERNFGEQHPTTAGRYSNLATVLQALGDYAGAKTLLEKALASDERNFGPDHPTTAVRYSNLASVLKALGDYAGAKTLLEKALASAEHNFGPEHPTTAVSYSNLAGVLQALGDYAGAKTLLEKASASDERNFGPEHPTTAVSYSNLAGVLQALGDYAGAKTLLEKALAAAERNFGPEHPTTAVRYSNLAVVLQALGDYAGAKTLLEKALAAAERHFGEQHPTTVVSYTNFGAVLAKMGDYPQARRYLQKALGVFREQLGEGHPHTQTVVSLLEQLEALEQGRE